MRCLAYIITNADSRKTSRTATSNGTLACQRHQIIAFLKGMMMS